MELNNGKSSLKAESVASNPFFQVLRQTYNELYSLAAKRGWKICVPHSKSISGCTLNEHFFKSHIFQSSPYFKEEYVTLNGQCVIYKDGVISTKTGFDSPRKVYVLGEELFYTEIDFKSFTVYCISSPLIGSIVDYNDNSETHTNDRNSISGSHTRLSRSSSMISNHSNHHETPLEQILSIQIENRTELHWKKFLSLVLDSITHRRVMNEIFNFAQQFNRSYVMIKGYTRAASKRIEEFRNATFSEYIISENQMNYRKKDKQKTKQKPKKLDKKTLNELQSTFDSYLSTVLFDRVFNTFLVRHFKKEDDLFSDKLQCLQSLSQQIIGVKIQFQSNQSKAITELRSLNKYKAPIHKLGCLKRTCQYIRDSIETKDSTCDDEEMAITTDDMLSLFTFILIQSNLKMILSNNEYLTHFYYPLHCSAHCDYYFATYQATIQYITKQLFIPKHLKNKKQNNIKKQSPPMYAQHFKVKTNTK